MTTEQLNTLKQDTSAYQRAVGEIPDKHVYGNHSTEVDYILSAEEAGVGTIARYDDVVNYHHYPETELSDKTCIGPFTKDQLGEAKETAEKRLEDHRKDCEDITEFTNCVSSLEDCQTCIDLQDDIDMLDDLDLEPQEILEWWSVSSWLKRQLEARGEPVLEIGSNHYWGRCCSGQAIKLDSVIEDIWNEELAPHRDINNGRKTRLEYRSYRR